VSEVLYLDTSAVLRSVLERGVTPEVDRRLGGARYLLTSRLTLVEAARALSRLRIEGIDEPVLADAARELDSLWARTAVWELSKTVCDLAGQLAPHQRLRTLDALHLATFVLARRNLGETVSLLTTDSRLEQAAAGV
jgi:predicted nucleic acid-binding protein